MFLKNAILNSENYEILLIVDFWLIFKNIKSISFKFSVSKNL